MRPGILEISAWHSCKNVSFFFVKKFPVWYPKYVSFNHIHVSVYWASHIFPSCLDWLNWIVLNGKYYIKLENKSEISPAGYKYLKYRRTHFAMFVGRKKKRIIYSVLLIMIILHRLTLPLTWIRALVYSDWDMVLLCNKIGLVIFIHYALYIGTP